MTLESRELNIDRLLLDPNNFRFLGNSQFTKAEANRFHESSVQARTYRRLRDDVLQLKNSILKNGLLPVERLVVKEYLFLEDRYVVLEGNRRLTAMRWILEDHQSGVIIPESILESIKNIPVLVVMGVHSDPVFVNSLLGVRHVSGIKEWGGYQRSALVATLKDDLSLDTSDVSDRLGMTNNEVNRRYRAFKALQQMETNEDYEDLAQPEMYPLFHELVSIPVLREWLGWNEASTEFEKEANLTEFYELIVSHESDDGMKEEAKITTYSQVRELRNIIPNLEAKRILLDRSRSYNDAVSIVKTDERSKFWKSTVAEAISTLNSLSVPDVKSLSAEDIAEIEKLGNVAKQVVESNKKLAS